MRFVWIDPNFFDLYPNSIQTGGVVQFCQDDDDDGQDESELCYVKNIVGA